MSIEVFNRYEKKFILNTPVYLKVKSVLSDLRISFDTNILNACARQVYCRKL